MRIGNLELEGNIVQLKKPMVITRSVNRKNGDTGEMPRIDLDGQPSNSLVVVGLIRQKYVFNTRPQPIVTSGKS